MKNLKSISIDLLIWFYLCLLLYKIVWQRIIVDIESELSMAVEIQLCLLFGVFFTAIFYFIKTASIGKELMMSSSLVGDYSRFKKISTYIFILVFLLTVISGWIITEISLIELFSKTGFDQASNLFSQLLSPNFSILSKTIIAAIETIFMAFMATLIAIPIAFLLSFFSAKNIMKGVLNTSVYFFVRLVMNFMRSIEPLIWAIIFSVWVGIGPFAGMMALMLHSIVSLAKLYSEQIEETEVGPIEAIRATGANSILVIWYGIVPQIINPFLSYTIYRWDINVRMATIIGMVGGGGVGNLLMQYQGMAKWNEVGTIVLVIAVIVWLMDFASATIRESLSK